MNTARPRIFRSVLPPLVTCGLLLGAWWIVVELFHVKSYFLPTPDEVLLAAWRVRVELLAGCWLTARAAVGGFVLSVITGSLISLVFSQFPTVRLGCFPYAVILQTVPIVALAPIIINWQGAGFQSVMLVSFIVSLFPIIANATAGLTSVDRSLLELFQLNQATRLQVICKLQIPHAVADLVTGARTSAGLAVIGAIVGEFFAGNSTRSHGLGFMIPRDILRMKTDEAFAAVIAATALGISMFALVSILRATLLAKWCNARP